MSTANGKTYSDSATISFIVALSLSAALILALLASSLKAPQEAAKELDRSKQLLLAAQIYNHAGYLQMPAPLGKGYTPAKHVGGGVLIPGSKTDIATPADIIAVYKARVQPFLVDRKGNKTTFTAASLDLDEYLQKHKKIGYRDAPWLPIYEILPDPKSSLQVPVGYVVPVSGFGLWDFIAGYLALEPDGNTVLGISWYEQKETPGLGANIAEADWQSLFPGKQIYQANSDGQIDRNRSQIGITVVRGRVQDVIGTGPKSRSSVDGMAGATLTGNGVTKAYKESLEPYRVFFNSLASTRSAR